MNAPSMVTQRRPENRISSMPDRAGQPDHQRNDECRAESAA